MTSSISAARRVLWDDSPITQRIASTRFDLPQPFGPTMPVSPGSIRKSVASTKDLKPRRRSFVSFIVSPRGAGRRYQLFEQRFDGLVELGYRKLAAETLAVDEECRRAIDLELVAGALLHRHDAIIQGLVLQAFLELFLCKTGLLGDLGEGGQHLGGVDEGPALLLGEQHVDHRVIFVVAARSAPA